MMTKEYLDELKKRQGLTSDYQLAKLLESSTPVISRYRTGERVMDDYTAARVAELLGIDPLRVIAQANAERESNETKRAFWRKLAACVICGIGVNLALPGAHATQVDSEGYKTRERQITHYVCFRPVW